MRLAPAGARLWLDGKPASAPATATPGLHWVVVERADLAPSTRIVRITRAAPEIAVNLTQPAAPAEALRQTAVRLASAPLERDEGLAVSAELHRPLWLIGMHNGLLVAQRFAADDVAHATDEKSAPSPPALADALCTVERCTSPAAPVATAVAPTAAPSAPAAPLALTASAPPERPVWKRGWFWGVLVGSAAVAAAVIAGSVVGATAARDYDLRVR